MTNHDKTKEELIEELQELKQVHDALKVSFEEDINQRKQMEEALIQSESKYRLLAQNSSDVIWTLDNDYRFTYISPSIYHLRGLTPEEAMRETIQDTMTPYSQEVVYKAIIKGKENEKAKNYVPVKVEIEQYHKDGHLIWVEINIRAMLNDEGEKIGYVGISRNITERKLAVKALSESLERFESLLTKVPVGVYIFWIRANGHMEFEYVSDRWCEIHQISREDALTDVSLVHKQIHKDDIEHFLLLNQESARDRKAFDWEGRFMSGGDLRWFHIESIPKSYDNGDIQWYGVTQDITERKRVEEALRNSEEKFRSLADMAKVVIAITADAGGEKYLYVNDEWARVHEYSKEEAKYLKPIDLVDPDSKQQVLENAAKRIQGNQVSTNYEIKTITKSGNIKDFDFSSTIINFENQKAFLTTSIDITERKQTEKALRDSEVKLRELNAQKDKFFSIIAHDLKSPFNAIMGFSELLMDQINEKNYNGIDEYAKIIGQSSQRAFDLLINLLDWSRAQTGRMEYNPEKFELVDVIRENVILFDVIAGQKAITINNVLPHEITVFADKPMVSTVFRNLITNAIKYTRQGGEINISAEKRAKEILVSVSDNGIGIAPGRLESLFRIDESNSTPGTNNEKGTGLGLILCKEFVEKHGGKIWVESEEGKGSVFYFSLPCNPEQTK